MWEPRSGQAHGERHAHSARPYPPLIWAATSASALMSRSTKCAWPQATAHTSAVHLRTRLESDSPQQLHSVFGARPYPSLALADTSALAAMSSSTTRMLPLPTAAISAVHLPHTRLGSDGARQSHPVCYPSSSAEATSAPAAMSSSTTCSWPVRAASMSAVSLPHYGSDPTAHGAWLGPDGSRWSHRHTAYPSLSFASRSVPAAMRSSITRVSSEASQSRTATMSAVSLPCTRLQIRPCTLGALGAKPTHPLSWRPHRHRQQ